MQYLQNTCSQSDAVLADLYPLFDCLAGFAGDDPKLSPAAMYELKDAENYRYLNQSQCVHVSSIDDRRDFDDLLVRSDDGGASSRDVCYVAHMLARASCHAAGMTNATLPTHAAISAFDPTFRQLLSGVSDSCPRVYHRLP